MALEGADEIKRNMAAFLRQKIAQAEDAADESAHLLESYAKSKAPFTDRTGNLRNSIKGTHGRIPRGQRIVISAGMSYAPWVELGTSRSKAYAFLWPAIAENAGRIKEVFRRHLQ
jgi:HK97 gp10 family phage protein